ncbi:MAG: hypothetical protein K6B70_05450 [Clostridia bacterium]|nr:hypothetical protein [Clostridia bacterium]
MDAHEFADDVKKGELAKETFEKIIKWCEENTSTLEPNDKDQTWLYEMATNYLMKYKIGKWNKDEAAMLITYLAKKSAREFGISENVDVKIFEREEYEKIYGKSSMGICTNNGDNTFNISYSPIVVDNLLSNDYDQFLRGMQTVFHEVTHAVQNSVIQRKEIQGIDTPKTKNSYIMALETIARKFNPDFYKKYYAHLIKENHAEKTGLKLAMETMQKYNPRLYQAYNQEVIAQRLENYDKNFFNYEFILQSGKKTDFMVTIDTLCSLYIEEHPEMVEMFPVLQAGYNLDGTKKDIRHLISEREAMIATGKPLDKIDELYETIANHRNVTTNGLKGTKDELNKLHDYIEETGTEDEFVFRLMRYRLENKTRMSPEAIEKFMASEYANAAKTRQARQIQEIQTEQSESIRDEVGDEFKPKTEQRRQEEQQVEAMWQSRFQSWDRDSVELPNTAKRKQEAVQVMKKIEKEKEVEKQEKNDELQQ